MTGVITAATGIVVSAACVTLLHLLRTDLPPHAHRLSEYATGPYGWLMTLAFVALAAGLTGFAAFLWSTDEKIGASIALVAAVASLGADLGLITVADKTLILRCIGRTTPVVKKLSEVRGELEADLDATHGGPNGHWRVTRAEVALPNVSSKVERVDGRTLDRFAADEQSDPEAQVIDQLLTEEIDRALRSLPARDAKVLRLYFGLNEGREHTLEEIGGLLGVTRERVRQLQEVGPRRR